MKVLKWIKNDLVQGTTKFDWMYLSIGLALQIFAIIYGFITGTPDSLISIISGISGIFAVVFCAQAKLSSYIFNYTQLLTYMFGIAIPLALWGEVIENIFYFVTMIYGVYVWYRHYGQTNTGTHAVKARTFTLLGWITSIGLLIIFTGVGYVFLEHAHELLPAIFTEADPEPFLDSITTVAPFIGQILLVLGYREQWLFWIIEDIISTVMFAILGNWVMVAQYIFWTINCIYGWYKWTKFSKDII